MNVYVKALVSISMGDANTAAWAALTGHLVPWELVGPGPQVK